MQTLEPTNGSFQVTFVNTHYNHDNNPVLGRVPHDQENIISTQISSGATVNRILDNILELPATDEYDKLKTLTRKDIRNRIEKQRKTDGSKCGRRASVDFISCFLYFKSQENNEDILFYSNIESLMDVNSDGDKDRINSLLKDVEIVYSDNFQLNTALKYGENTIMVDSTFGITKALYDLKLTAILVLNEYKVGVPICYIISRRLNEDTWIRCLEKFKNKLGVPLQCNIFMTDDDSSYYNAWCKVMGVPTKKLLCSWHVSRSWTKKVKKIFKSKDERKVNMNTILNIRNSQSVEMLISEFNIWESNIKTPEENEFFSYIKKYYWLRKEEWADAYRIKAGIITNNHVESFFKTLKYQLLENKKSTRLDFLLHKLKLRSTYDYKKQIDMGDRGRACTEFVSKAFHNKSLKIELSQVNVTNEGWTFMSKTNKCYTVSKGECNDCKCLNRCLYCNVCEKKYVCDCKEFRVKENLCKHVHWVAVNDNNIDSNISSLDNNIPNHNNYPVNTDRSICTFPNLAPITSNNNILLRINMLKDVIARDLDLDFSFLTSGVIKLLDKASNYANQPSKHDVDNKARKRQQRY